MSTLTWDSLRSDVEQASIDDVVQRFNEARPVSKHNMNVRRLSETVVAKRVSFSPKREYDNQMLAWKVLNSEELRVPEPIRYIGHLDESGISFAYIVMEYLYGTSLDQVNEPSVEVVAEAILQIHSRSRDLAQTLRVGPPTGGFADGFPWGENGAEVQFHTIQDLEECVGKRLKNYADSKRLNASSSQLHLRQSDLGLCHLDLAPRNILILQDGRVGIVDWSTLACYPVVFELACLGYLQNIDWIHHLHFFGPLMSTLECSTGILEADRRKLEIVQSKSIQYWL